MIVFLVDSLLVILTLNFIAKAQCFLLYLQIRSYSVADFLVCILRLNSQLLCWTIKRSSCSPSHLHLVNVLTMTLTQDETKIFWQSNSSTSGASILITRLFSLNCTEVSDRYPRCIEHSLCSSTGWRNPVVNCKKIFISFFGFIATAK